MRHITIFMSRRLFVLLGASALLAALSQEPGRGALTLISGGGEGTNSIGWLGFTNRNFTIVQGAANTAQSSRSNSFYPTIAATNLLGNGSFELGRTNGGANQFGGGPYPNRAFATTNQSNPVSLIPTWRMVGQTTTPTTNNGANAAYPVWGNDGGTAGSSNRTVGGGVIPNGTQSVYFGNNIVPTAGSQVGLPRFASNGIVTGVTSLRGLFTNGLPTSGDPVILSQTVSNLSVGSAYSFSFWASGEDNEDYSNGVPIGTPKWGADGVFGLSVSGETFTTNQGGLGNSNTILLLAAPSGVTNRNPTFSSGMGQSHYYQFVFNPTTSVVTFSFYNWGHVNVSNFFGAASFGLKGSELVLDDVTLVRIPEPASLGVVAAAFLATASTRRRRQS